MAINRVTMMGNLTSDAQLHMIKEGLPVLNFSVAISERRRGENGEYVDTPVFVPCTMFGSRAQKLAPHLTKGTKVTVDGKLYYSTYLKDDEKRSRLSVTVQELEFAGAPKKDTREAEISFQMLPVEAPSASNLYDNEIFF